MVIDYKKPKDGTEYTSSIKEIFPKDIREKIEQLDLDNTDMKKEVEEYYSYLNEQENEQM